jgi:hypothetical protein
VVNWIACGKRVAKLHRAGRFSLCQQLAHASQTEDALTLGGRSKKIRQRLGDDWRNRHSRFPAAAETAEPDVPVSDHRVNTAPIVQKVWKPLQRPSDAALEAFIAAPEALLPDCAIKARADAPPATSARTFRAATARRCVNR